MAYIPYISSFEPLCLGPKSSISWIHQKTRPWKTPTVHGPEAVSAISALSRWQKGASQKWQRVQLLWQVLAALWMPTVLWANTAMSRWLPAMAMSHSTLVLGMAHHAFRRLQPPAAARGTAGLNGRGAACGECGATGCVATAALGLRAGTECDMDPPWGFDLSLQSQGERTQPTMLSRFSIDTRFLRGILGSCHSLCFVGMGFPANWPANFPLFIHRNCLRGG